MTTTEIANRLIELCREATFVEAMQELYADDAVSIEPFGEPSQISGKENMLMKLNGFMQSMEVHSNEVSDPLVVANHFVCTMKMDATIRESGLRHIMEEICIYTVENGQIVSEEFFYSM